ncbi:S-adenosyl-L-methionine-dependent methyltransferase [Serendipita vermifera]|nr:S-adenosyl-L-methionine-dependent methyltransferase [Serendipita vermifera]
MDRTHAATTDDDAAQSTYSYNSGRDWAMFFKEIDGRRFSNQSSTYILPADDIEFIRLDKQHAAHLIGLGGLYPCPDLVERVLAPESGITKEILDLGCGTGIWALSMARQFPHTRVTGVDMAPTPLGDDQVPSNIVFEIDNINYGLEQFTGRFDLVHMRCTASGLPDFAQATTYAAQCLKPGGLLLLVDLDTQLCAEDMVTIQKIATPNQPDGSWLARYFYEVRSAFDTSGIDTSKLSETLDRALWDHPLLTNCGAGSMFNPVGPWFKSFDPEEKQRLEFAGILMRQNLKAAIYAFHTLFRKKGIPQESIDELTTKAIVELESLKVHLWIRLSLAWGIRRFPDQDQDSSSHGTANEGPSGSIQPLPKSNWQPHYRTIHIYKTEEESQAARKLRQDTVGELVEPMVSLVEENQS